MIKEIKFGKIKPGTIFCLSERHFELETNYKNIKLNTFAIACDKNGKFDKNNGENPFNVIALSDGRPRSFHDDFVVYVDDGA